MAALPAEYRAEPALALAGGDDGMDLVRRIVARRARAPERRRRAGARDRPRARRTSRPPSRASKCAWLETSAGDDAVVLIERRALAILTAARPLRRAPSALRRLRRKSRHARSLPTVPAPRRQARARPRQRHAATPARRSAWSAATAPASRRCSRCSPAGCTPTPATSRMPPRWRIAEVAQEMPETDEGATDFVLAGRHRACWRRRRELAAAEASGDGHAIADAHHAISEAGGFDARPRAQAMLLGLGFKSDRARRAGEQLLRRLAHAPAARARADVPGRPDAARRADQPPRPRRAGLARGLAAALRRHDDRHQPRPRVPRRDHQGHAAPRRDQADPLHRQLQRLRGDARRAPGAGAGELREAAGAHRAPAEVHRPLQGQGEQGQAGAEPGQGAGADGEARRRC